MRYQIPRLHEPNPAPIEPTLFYDPPYERPVEDELAWHLVKYLSPYCRILYQVKLEGVNPEWVDFVIERGGLAVGLEVGRRWTRRDQRILDSPLAGIVRMNPNAVMYRIHDCLQAVARAYPALFSEKGKTNLDTLSDNPIRASHYTCMQERDPDVEVTYDHYFSHDTTVSYHPHNQADPIMQITLVPKDDMEMLELPDISLEDLPDAIEAARVDADSLYAKYAEQRRHLEDFELECELALMSESGSLYDLFVTDYGRPTNSSQRSAFIEFCKATTAYRGAEQRKHDLKRQYNLVKLRAEALERQFQVKLLRKQGPVTVHLDGMSRRFASTLHAAVNMQL